MNLPLESNRSAKQKLLQTIKNHPLMFFFIIAYAFSWILSIPFILSEWGVLRGNYQAFFPIKSFGPFVSAFLMTYILEGKDGLKRLETSIKQTRASGLIYLFILLGIPVLIILGIILQPGKIASFQGFKPLLFISYPLAFVLVFGAGGPLGEEPGWRGFALPRMQKSYGPLLGTLLLGVVWTCWHLPDFLTSVQGGGPGTGISAFLNNFPIFLVLVIEIAILLTWVYNRTRGSVFISVLAHASVNTPQLILVPLFLAVDTTSLNLAYLIGFGVTAIVILILTRGRLGYQVVDNLVKS